MAPSGYLYNTLYLLCAYMTKYDLEISIQKIKMVAFRGT
jgi:hypothetical protein